VTGQSNSSHTAVVQNVEAGLWHWLKHRAWWLCCSCTAVQMQRDWAHIHCSPRQQQLEKRSRSVGQLELVWPEWEYALLQLHAWVTVLRSLDIEFSSASYLLCGALRNLVSHTMCGGGTRGKRCYALPLYRPEKATQCAGGARNLQFSCSIISGRPLGIRKTQRRTQTML